LGEVVHQTPVTSFQFRVLFVLDTYHFIRVSVFDTTDTSPTRLDLGFSNLLCVVDFAVIASAHTILVLFFFGCYFTFDAHCAGYGKTASKSGSVTCFAYVSAYHHRCTRIHHHQHDRNNDREEDEFYGSRKGCGRVRYGWCCWTREDVLGVIAFDAVEQFAAEWCI
jgi:hypothetical protein